VKCRVASLVLFACINAVPAHAELLSFDQARVCLDVANAVDAVTQSIEPLGFVMAAKPFNTLRAWDTVSQIERSSRVLSSIAQDSQYLVPWWEIDELLSESDLKGGYKSALELGFPALSIYLTAEQLRLELESNNEPDFERSNKISGLSRSLGYANAIREVCGRLFLGKS
jgi:hypothetical protein